MTATTWSDRLGELALLPLASFRGVSWHVTRSRGQFGREGVVHPIPDGDWQADDLGRLVRPIVLEGFLLDADDDPLPNQIARLVEAVETPGPGPLVHPWRGRLEVDLPRIDDSQSFERVGAYAFTFTATEHRPTKHPTVAVDRTADVVSKAATAQSALAAATASALDFSLAPWLEDSLDDWLEGALAWIGEIGPVLQPFFEDAEGFGRAWQAIDSVELDQTETLLGLFAEAWEYVGSFEIVRRALTYLDVSTTPSTQSGTGTTPAELADAANRAAFNRGIIGTIVVYEARTLAEAELDSVAEAEAARDDVVGRLDDLIASSEPDGGDEDAKALTALRTAVVLDIRDRIEGLPEIVELRIGAPTSALELSWSWHRSAIRAEEIYLRNNLRDPLFVPGDSTIQVLSR